MKFNNNPTFLERVNQLNEVISQIPMASLSRENSRSWPLVLKLGSSRSGSTLFSQWIASLGSFAYPSNFLSLFPRSPLLGARIFELVTNPMLRYNNEFADIAVPLSFESISGKTSGFREPNEFWQFWLQYFELPEVPVSDEAWLATSDFTGFNATIDLLTREFDRPFVIKGHHLSPYLRVVAENLNNAIFVHMYRDPIDIMSSVLRARVTRYGDIDHFFGWRPREYELIADLSILRQVAGQVYFNERAILERVPAMDQRYMSFSYAQFCKDPEKVLRRILALVNQYSPEPISSEYRGPGHFSFSRCEDDEERAILESEFAYWTSKYGPLDYDLQSSRENC